MRLLFLCGSLEPGRDGVGDYVRLLAGACARRGHACALLALNDSYVESSHESIFEMAGEQVSIMRLPNGLSWNERVERAGAFRDRFRPDWISFHLVPYAFHPRGILLKLAETFREITGSVPLHLMFHELWLGAGRPTPLRQRLTGLFQRRGVRRLLQRLHPRLVTTSNPVYAAMLRKLGAKASILPLFGNVPVVESDAPEVTAPVFDTLARAGIAPEDRAGWWIGLFFGALHAEWKPEPFLGLLQRGAEQAGKRVCLVLAGRASAVGEETWRKMEAAYGPRIAFVNLGGDLSPAAISAWLHAADFGVAASPWQLIGKSGTVAAMLDHGLPVIVTRDDFQPDLSGDRPPSSDPLVHRLDESLPAKLVAGLPKRAARHRADEIAGELCAAMEATSGIAPPAP